MIITNNQISLDDFERVVFKKEKVILSNKAKKRISSSNSNLLKIVSKGVKIYGVNLNLAGIRVTVNASKEFQEKIVKAHTVGFGNYAKEEIVRGMLFLRINSISKGVSGTSLSVANLLVDFLNKGVIPAVPEKGSVGASGDLSPQAYVANCLLGEGNVFYKGKIMSTKKAMTIVKIEPATFSIKDGISLINGTDYSTALAAVLAITCENIITSADSIASISNQSCFGLDSQFNLKGLSLKPYPEVIQTAKIHLGLLAGSTLINANQKNVATYSFYCIPQVHGAFKRTLNWLKETINIEMNSVTDSPLLIENDVISVGNYHGALLATPLEAMKTELCVLGQISEKRIEILIDQKNEIVPKYLCAQSEAPSKFMMIQYNAAALVSENATLSSPANAFSVPTALGLEDINSMAPINARQAIEILENVKFIISGELVCAAKAVEFVKKKGLLSKSAKKILIKLGPISDVNKSLESAQKLISEGYFSSAEYRK